MNGKHKIMQSAVSTFGERSQVNMFFEEAAELQNAICKYYRGRGTIENIAEEIADVQIMLEQLSIIFDCNSTVRTFIDQKIERLAKRIGEYEKI